MLLPLLHIAVGKNLARRMVLRYATREAVNKGPTPTGKGRELYYAAGRALPAAPRRAAKGRGRRGGSAKLHPAPLPGPKQPSCGASVPVPGRDRDLMPVYANP